MPLLTPTKPTSTLNCQEVYGIWDTLSAKYQFLEKLHIWRNFAHDIDLKLVLNTIDSRIADIVKTIEKHAKKYSINGPEVGVKDINTSANTEVIRDELIAQDTFIWLQGITELLLRTLRTTTTNDEVRKLIISINKKNLDMMDHMITFLSLKGWINTPPIYPKIPQNVNEAIDSGEAFHLWDHLTFRYDNIHQTEMYKDVIKDTDLNVLATVGLQGILKKQAAKLEQFLLKFGVPLPKQPATVISLPSEIKHYYNDDYIYRLLLIGMIGATNIHVAAVKQSVTNAKVRKFFIELLESEIDILSNFIIYGKMKGYLNEAPQYNASFS